MYLKGVFWGLYCSFYIYINDLSLVRRNCFVTLFDDDILILTYTKKLIYYIALSSIPKEVIINLFFKNNVYFGRYSCQLNEFFPALDLH